MNKRNKIITSCIATIAIATVVALNVNYSEKTNGLSGIALTNIEALSWGEDPEGKVSCCPEAKDTCTVGTTDVPDYDECK